MEVGKNLIGIKAIKAYTRRSWPTIRKWVDKNFPARRIDRVWTSRTDLIDAWLTDQIMQPQRGGDGE